MKIIFVSLAWQERLCLASCKISAKYMQSDSLTHNVIQNITRWAYISEYTR